MNKIQEIIKKNIERNNSFKNYIFNDNDIKELIKENIDYLSSEKAFRDIDNDPYWDKWCTPWWRINILFEMGLLELVPQKTLTILEEKINSHYIKFFPFVESEVPEGINPIKQIICHCQLGSIYKIFNQVNSSINFQWAREWFIKYQLNDGGLNCDESVYTRENPKSSIVSTLPCLEAVLSIKDLNEEEKDFLDKGAEYLINKKIFRNSKDEIIDKNWLQAFFPRFYEFDILRGLSFLTEWALLRNKDLPIDSIYETLEILDSKIEDNLLKQGDMYFLYYRQTNKLFPLLEYFNNSKNLGNIYLSKQWYKTIENLSLIK
jgi:hypothetical protein